MRFVRNFLVILAVLGISLGVVAQQQPPQPPKQAQSQPADPEAWPRTVQNGDNTLTVYQPQLDSWDGFYLSAHYALSFQKGKDAPIYGVAWATAITSVDKDT